MSQNKSEPTKDWPSIILVLGVVACIASCTAWVNTPVAPAQCDTVGRGM